ncbi:MAG: addiction module protein [Planctomycetes bacterium]|nr:addiction module protein [Planctomycetota bacterium]
MIIESIAKEAADEPAPEWQRELIRERAKEYRRNPEGGEDVRSIRAHYDQKRRGLGREFVARLFRVARRVAEFPESFFEIEEGVRWDMTRQFPFKVFFMPGEARSR